MLKYKHRIGQPNVNKGATHLDKPALAFFTCRASFSVFDATNKQIRAIS